MKMLSKLLSKTHHKASKFSFSKNLVCQKFLSWVFHTLCSKLQIQNGRCVQVHIGHVAVPQYQYTSGAGRDQTRHMLPMAGPPGGFYRGQLQDKSSYRSSGFLTSKSAPSLALGYTPRSVSHCITVLKKYVDISRRNKKLFINHNLSKT